jgi:ABC-type uncharacterized transport system permease subunit
VHRSVQHKSIHVKKYQYILTQLSSIVVAIFLSFIVGGIFIAAVGKDPLVVYERFFSQTLGSTYGIGQVLFKATSLMFTGLSAAICFRAGLFNIGAEGQLTIGAFATALVGFLLSTLPPTLLIPLCLLAGVVGGALWGAIPGILKARFGAHEVINTIMMNFIAAAFVSYMVSNIFLVPATVHTPQIAQAAELSRLEEVIAAFHGAPVNMSLIIAVISCFLVYIFLQKTPYGYSLRATGLSLDASEYGHINTKKQMIIALSIGGGLAGLGGSNFVLGYKHYFELGFSEGAGFIGIAVALLARNNPLAIIITSIFFGMLEYGSLTINTIVPKELINILQAIVIIFIIVLSKVVSQWLEKIQKHQVFSSEHV